MLTPAGDTTLVAGLATCPLRARAAPWRSNLVAAGGGGRDNATRAARATEADVLACSLQLATNHADSFRRQSFSRYLNDVQRSSLLRIGYPKDLFARAIELGWIDVQMYDFTGVRVVYGI